MTQGNGVYRFCLCVPVALRLLVITHKPRKCLSNLVNHLRKEKQTSYGLVLLVCLKGVLEKGLQMSKVKRCLERYTFFPLEFRFCC